MTPGKNALSCLRVLTQKQYPGPDTANVRAFCVLGALPRVQVGSRGYMRTSVVGRAPSGGAKAPDGSRRDGAGPSYAGRGFRQPPRNQEVEMYSYKLININNLGTQIIRSLEVPATHTRDFAGAPRNPAPRHALVRRPLKITLGNKGTLCSKEKVIPKLSGPE